MKERNVTQNIRHVKVVSLVSPTHRLSLPYEIFLALISVRG